jgi:subtilisin-like proprotein convertase family protein
MDDARFDTLARSLSDLRSRRGVLGLVSATTLGGLLASLGVTASEAQRKKKKKKKKTPAVSVPANDPGTAAAPPPPPTGPARTTITGIFANSAPITINPGDALSGATKASPYPAVVEVAGFTNGKILDVNLTLHGLSHEFPTDIDILLVAPAPVLNAFVLGDVGSGQAVSNITLTLDDQAAAGPPTPLISGTFKPTNSSDGSGSDTFPDPAPAPGGNVALSVFNGSNPNGTWQLFVVDDARQLGGSIAGGWSLRITAEVDG